MNKDTRERMLTEYKELSVRLDALKAFLAGDMPDVNATDARLLRSQELHMTKYRDVLKRRITRSLDEDAVMDLAMSLVPDQKVEVSTDGV